MVIVVITRLFHKVGCTFKGGRDKEMVKDDTNKKNGFWVCGFTLLMLFFSGEMFFRVSRHVMTCLPSASGKLT